MQIEEFEEVVNDKIIFGVFIGVLMKKRLLREDIDLPRVFTLFIVSTLRLNNLFFSVNKKLTANSYILW